MDNLQADVADRLARTALDSVARVYPYKPGIVLLSDADLSPPAATNPVFRGCFDWHSSVHSHWTLARLRRLTPGRPWRAEAEKHFNNTFTDLAVATELTTLERQPGFEVPYGLAWLLTLADELRNNFHSEPWGRRLRPLEELAADRLERWLRSLHYPIRSGQHSQSAFAMTTVLRWAHKHHSILAKLIRHKAIEFHAEDRDAPFDYEPSAHDFLSPCLGVAELMGEVLPPSDYSRWLDAYAPSLHRKPTLEPVEPVDRSDGRLAHFDGLNLSRAWMLRNIASSLPENDHRAARFAEMADHHGVAGMEGLSSDEYAVTHWLPTFALCWLTGQT